MLLWSCVHGYAYGRGNGYECGYGHGYEYEYEYGGYDYGAELPSSETNCQTTKCYC
jgi:hypothetical protein